MSKYGDDHSRGSEVELDSFHPPQGQVYLHPLGVEVSIATENQPAEQLVTEEPLTMEQFRSKQWNSTTDSARLRWFHVPYNNTSDIDKIINAIHPRGNSVANGENHLDLQNVVNPGSDAVFNQSWRSHVRPVASLPESIILPHSRFMEPGCRALPKERTEGSDHSGALFAFLPYMNWEVYKNIGTPQGPQISSNASRDHNSDHDMYHRNHHRRTLDQFYYSGLTDTTFRDADQTVSKWTGEEMGASASVIGKNGRPRAVADSRVVMIDQLWLFVANSKYILTFFPSHSHGITFTNLYEDLKKQVHQCKDAYDFAALATSHAMTMIFNENYRKDADLYGIYQWAIGNKAARQIKCFDRFFKKSSNVTSDTNAKEFELTREVADILDELNMLDNLLAKQEDVWRSLNKTLSEWRPAQRDFTAAHERVDVAITQEEKSTANITITSRANGRVGLHQHAASILNLAVAQDEGPIAPKVRAAGIGGESLEKSWLELQHAIESVKRLRHHAKDTHELLLNLLNLKQTAASLEESRVATTQGRAVMLFTIVTIIFLPLSFFTSWFGQNISEYTGDVKNPKGANLWKIGGPISAGVIILALLFAYYIYNPESKVWVRLGLSDRHDGQADENV